MSLAPLRIAAAKYVIDAVSSEDLRRVADEALTRGVYSYSRGELGTDTKPNVLRGAPLFHAAMQELGIPLPSIQEVPELVEPLFPPIDGRSGDALTHGRCSAQSDRSLG